MMQNKIADNIAWYFVAHTDMWMHHEQYTEPEFELSLWFTTVLNVASSSKLVWVWLIWNACHHVRCAACKWSCMHAMQPYQRTPKL